MYILILFPLFIAGWFLLAKFVFAEKFDHKPLLLFAALFAGSLAASEFVLGDGFSWMRFTPVGPKTMDTAHYWQHGISALIVAGYLITKRSYKVQDIAIALTLWVVCNTAFVTSVVINARIDYPFELEWMEGTMVDQVVAVKQQGMLYREASFEFTPFLYGPVFTRAISVLPYTSESPFLWGRLLSLLMAGLVGLLIYFYTTTLARDGWIGVLLAAAFWASNPFTDYWFDIYRVDTTFLFLLILSGALLWQRPQSNWAVAVSGIALALAVFTKQAASLMVIAYVLWFFWAHGWRRTLWLVGSGAASGLALMTVELVYSGTYFFTYFFDMLFIRSITWKLVRGQFINKDLLGLPLLLTIFMATSALIAHFRQNGAKVWSKDITWVIIVFFTISSFLMRSKGGGWFNCRMPMIAAGLVGTGLWFGQRRSGKGLAGVYPGLILLLVYMFFMDPLGQNSHKKIPTAGDHKAATEFTEYLKSRPGDVWVPFHSHYCYIAKGHLCASTIAVADWNFLHESVPNSFTQALNSNDLSTIVFDSIPGWFKRPLRQALNSKFNCNRTKFNKGAQIGIPVTGWSTRPRTVCERKNTKPD